MGRSVYFALLLRSLRSVLLPYYYAGLLATGKGFTGLSQKGYSVQVNQVSQHVFYGVEERK